METKLAFVEELMSLERRVCRIYLAWAAKETFPADLRSFFKAMAEEEKQHLAILEQSAGLLNFAEAPPAETTARLSSIESCISLAERAKDKPELAVEEVLGLILALESSELNQLDDAWLTGFHPDVGKLRQTWIPAHREHIRRLCNAVDKFSADEHLRREAAALSAYQATTGRS